MIWATLIFAIGIAIAFRLTKKPKRAEPATWAQTILGAMCMWAMMALGYGTIPHEWLTFGNSYLNFNTATYVMRQNRFIHFDITSSVVIDMTWPSHPSAQRAIGASDSRSSSSGSVTSWATPVTTTLHPVCSNASTSSTSNATTMPRMAASSLLPRLVRT